jgi:undecaprenyl diphosphate synthase
MHVAIIMDGNGRWAQQRGLPRTAGHQAGARAVRRCVETASRADVDVLTLYAFSANNWSRPPGEVSNLMRLFKRYLLSEVARCVENGVRINVIGRRDRLKPDLVEIIEQAEDVTQQGNRLTLRLAVDYSAREAIANAAHVAHGACGAAGCADAAGSTAVQCFEEHIRTATHTVGDQNAVDLLIRTGGERRLSDFLLWECAYAELHFVDAYWPDFDERAFQSALDEFRRRDRRFGGLSGAAAELATQSP